MSSVFGSARRPAYMVTRTDERGRPISLDLRPPEGNSVLFTGGPGMGSSLELDRAQQLAIRSGWTCVRVDASPRETLENRFVRAVSEDLGGLRKRFGYFAVRRLKKILRDLTQQNKNQQNGAEVRLGVPPVQLVAKRQWDAPGQNGVGSTINQLADQLGELAARKREPVMLMVDNVDVASDRDVAALTELAAHLEQKGQPVYLIAAGGEMAATRLMQASGGMSGIQTGMTQRFDIRECPPLADDELRPAVTEPLRQAGIRYQSEAVESLVKAAGGSPSRLRDLAETAVQLSQLPDGITADVAKAAAAEVNARSRVVYQAAWNICSDVEKDLLTKVAMRGSRGLQLNSEAVAAGAGRWQLDTARQNLVARGLLREHPNSDRVTVGDPGLRDWVETRVGQAAAQSGIASPGTQSAIGQDAVGEQHATEGQGRPAESANTRTRTVGNTTFTVNR